MTSLRVVLERLIRIENALLILAEDDALSPTTRAAIARALSNGDAA